MGIERGDGFVLRIRAFGDADIIVTLLLHGYGKRTAIAKGVRRLNSRLGGVFDLLNQVEVVFYARDRLDLVSQAALISSNEAVKRDLGTINSALTVARFLDRLLPLHQPEDEVYRLFTRFITMATAGSGVEARIATELWTLTLLGHRPQLHACLQCGTTVGPFRFIPARGGVLCSRCKGNVGIPLTTGLARALAWLATHPIERSRVIHLSPEEQAQADEILNAYLETRIHEG